MSGLPDVSVYVPLMLVKGLTMCNTLMMNTQNAPASHRPAETADTSGPVVLAFCPRFHHAVELIGRRWTGAIVRAMLSGVTQFSGLREAVPGLSDRMLSERLKELEAEGIVVRTVIPDTPVRITYDLTDKGHALSDVLDSIAVWAEQWLSAAPASTDAPICGAIILSQ